MKMNELENYNEQIFTIEKDIFNRDIAINELTRALDVAKFIYKNGLDPKIKEYSNDEKREAEALKQVHIKELSDDLKKFLEDTELKKIELRYMLRKLQIMIKSELI